MLYKYFSKELLGLQDAEIKNIETNKEKTKMLIIYQHISKILMTEKMSKYSFPICGVRMPIQHLFTLKMQNRL